MTVIRRYRPSRPNAPSGTKKVSSRQIVTSSSGNYNRSIFSIRTEQGRLGLSGSVKLMQQMDRDASFGLHVFQP